MKATRRAAGRRPAKFGTASMSGFYRLEGEVAGIERAARGEGLDFVRVGLLAVTDKAGLLGALAQALGFPDTFGSNWDAASDCLTDLSWRPAGGHVLVLDGVARYASADPAGWAVFAELVQDACAFWRGQKRAFIVVAAGEVPEAPSLPLLQVDPHEHVPHVRGAHVPGCCG